MSLEWATESPFPKVDTYKLFWRIRTTWQYGRFSLIEATGLVLRSLWTNDSMKNKKAIFLKRQPLGVMAWKHAKKSICWLSNGLPQPVQCTMEAWSYLRDEYRIICCSKCYLLVQLTRATTDTVDNYLNRMATMCVHLVQLHATHEQYSSCLIYSFQHSFTLASCSELVCSFTSRKAYQYILQYYNAWYYYAHNTGILCQRLALECLHFKN